MKILRAIIPLAAAFLLSAAALPEDTALKTAIANPQRTAAFVARDQYRHPYESLAFWGVKPRQTVIEIIPGGGYWTEILAPYAKATGGRYVATAADPATAGEPMIKYDATFRARFADEAKYGKVKWQPWNGKDGALGAPGSADVVITARNIHDWMWTPGQVETILKQIHTVLKPGGILAVEEHRADPRAQVPEAHDGYVSTAYMFDTLKKAGFKLDEASEVNANPKDTKNYPFGVWTLPPTSTRKSLPYIGQWPGKPGEDTLMAPEAYQAIGESDRMTLRFRRVN